MPFKNIIDLLIRKVTIEAKLQKDENKNGEKGK